MLPPLPLPFLPIFLSPAPYALAFPFLRPITAVLLYGLIALRRTGAAIAQRRGGAETPRNHQKMRRVPTKRTTVVNHHRATATTGRNRQLIQAAQLFAAVQNESLFVDEFFGAKKFEFFIFIVFFLS